jgi:hypothetical protein
MRYWPAGIHGEGEQIEIVNRSIPQREQLQKQPVLGHRQQVRQLLRGGHVGEEDRAVELAGDLGARDRQAELAVVAQTQLVEVAGAEVVLQR